ncbi:MAG TPA: MarP family serine protease [Acidimicrobiales bacterium]
MNELDVMILAGTVVAGLGGYRLGFIARVASWIGMVIGFVLAALLLPTLVEAIDGPDATGRLLIASAALMGGAFIGQALGLMVGGRLHLAIPEGTAKGIDRSGGAIAGVMGVVVALWVLLPTMADVPGWPARQSRSSAVAGFIDSTLPPPPDTLQTLRQLVGENNFPQVFAALQEAPDIGPPPADSGLSPAVIDAVTRSTVRVEGVACRRIQEGSGFTVGNDTVVTNAHVVAGEDETDVVRPDGSRLDATVVAFDSDRDLAVLFAPGLNQAALPVTDTGEGGTGAVFGYPGGGDLRVSPFGVSQEIEAVGRDLYNDHETRRMVLVLSSDLHPGDSGAALVDDQGAVVGVAFAIAPDKPEVAYALTTEELLAVLGGDLSQEVDTGPCLR